MRDLSIIIVNWNSLAFTEACIESIKRSVRDVSFEVIVIDNASDDAPCTGLKTRFPDVTLILNERNSGFGQANNRAAQHTRGEVLLFLNPDTLVEGEVIAHMFNELMARPSAGVIGCRLLNPDRSLQLSSVQAFPTILNQVLSLDRFQRLWPRSRLWGKQALYPSEGQSLSEVDVVSGAALMIKRAVFVEAGGFKPQFFMYAEEVDLCASVKSLGYSVLHSSESEITHFGGGSTKQCKDGFAEIEMRESVYKFLSASRGSWYASLFRASLFISAVCRLAVLAAHRFCLRAFTRQSDDSAEQSWKKWLRIGLWALHLRRVVVPEKELCVEKERGQGNQQTKAAGPLHAKS